MATAVAGPEIERLIQLLARLPGLGPRSARRAALFLIKKREQIMAPLGAALQLVGPGRILFGTDYPYRTAAEHVRGIRALGLTEAQVAMIEDGNAMELIPRLRA